eukprot:g2291.t1
MIAGAKNRIHVAADGTIREWLADERRWILREDEKKTTPPPSEILLLTGREFEYKFSDGEFEIDGIPLIIHSSEARDAEDQQDADTGRIVWDGSVVLAKYLENNRELIENKKVIEVGAGTGLSGIAAAALQSKSVTLTDLPYCIPNIQRNVDDSEKVWAKIGLQKAGKLFVAPLDWLSPGKLEKFDVIIGADIVWLSDLVAPLVSVLEKLTNVNPEATVLLSHQTRSKQTDTLLFETLQSAGFTWNKNGEICDAKFSTDKIKVFKLRRDK